MEQYPESSNGIVRLVKFELDGKPNVFRMYVSRLVRKYRVSDAPFSKEPESLLHSTNAFKPVPIRDANREMHLTGKPPVLFNWWNCPSRISNGYVECANRLIKEADMRGHGYSFETLRARTLYRRNNLRRIIGVRRPLDRPAHRRGGPVLHHGGGARGCGGLVPGLRHRGDGRREDR